MTVNFSRTLNQKMAPDAGIAIGPILFIISVLGILAAAIAAGSGSFTTGTTSESNRAKAAAMIDIGQNLKIGFDRIMGLGVDFDDVVIAPINTSDDVDLFSPNGGGIAAPSIAMSYDPTSTVWYYPQIAIYHLGTSYGSRVAVLRVSKGVCDVINEKIAGITSTPSAIDLGDFTGSSLLSPDSDWPEPLWGQPVGCVANSNTAMDGDADGYYFYQVLGIQ